jgi:nucleotide-binding universal stress UspA family protein
MLKLNKILFPVDFSERAVGAAHYVEALTGRFNAELTLLHVVESADYLYGTLEFGGSALHDFHAERVAHSRKQLDTFLSGELGHFQVKRVLLEGDPARKIVEYSEQEHVDLIMMPSHGFGPFRRFVIGSVTAKILHDARIPVWTGIHMENAPPLDVISCKNILCAVDLSPAQSEHALNWAAALAAEYGAKLTLVHATPAVESRPAKYFDSEMFQTLIAGAREDLDKLQEKLGTSAEVYIEGGDPAAVVRKAAEHLEADLLVIGRGSAAEGFGRLRTHAYAIIRHSPCPVVSV